VKRDYSLVAVILNLENDLLKLETLRGSKSLTSHAKCFSDVGNKLFSLPKLETLSTCKKWSISGNSVSNSVKTKT